MSIYGAKPHNPEHSLEVYKSKVFSYVCVSVGSDALPTEVDDGALPAH